MYKNRTKENHKRKLNRKAQELKVQNSILRLEQQNNKKGWF